MRGGGKDLKKVSGKDRKYGLTTEDLGSVVNRMFSNMFHEYRVKTLSNNLIRIFSLLFCHCEDVQKKFNFDALLTC